MSEELDPQDIDAIARLINKTTLFVDLPMVGGTAKAQVQVGKNESLRLAKLVLTAAQSRGLIAPTPVIAFPDWVAGLSSPWQAVIKAAVEANNG